MFNIILNRGNGRPIALTGRSQYCFPARAGFVDGLPMGPDPTQQPSILVVRDGSL
jgi:hypothetical protein